MFSHHVAARILFSSEYIVDQLFPSEVNETIEKSPIPGENTAANILIELIQKIP